MHIRMCTYPHIRRYKFTNSMGIHMMHILLVAHLYIYICMYKYIHTYMYHKYIDISVFLYASVFLKLLCLDPLGILMRRRTGTGCCRR